MRGADTDAGDDAALRFDRFVDALIGQETGEATTPSGRSAHDDAGADTHLPDLAHTARLLYASLPRYHPPFAHAERLARRISRTPFELPGADPSAGPGPRAAAHGSMPGEPAWMPFDEEGAVVRRHARRLWLALASGVSIAMSLLGAALIVWHRLRSAERAERPA